MPKTAEFHSGKSVQYHWFKSGKTNGVIPTCSRVLEAMPGTKPPEAKRLPLKLRSPLIMPPLVKVQQLASWQYSPSAATSLLITNGFSVIEFVLAEYMTPALCKNYQVFC